MDISRLFFSHRRSYTALILGALLIGVLVLSALALPGTTWAQGGAGDPWQCNGDAYVTSGDPSPTTLSVVDTATDPWSLNPLLTFNQELNALAYNPMNNYMYAIEPDTSDTNPGEIYKIGQSGAEAIGLNIGTSGAPWAAGTIYYTQGDTTSARYIIIGITKVGGGGGGGYPYNVVNVEASPPVVTESGKLGNVYKDVVFNPDDGLIYGIAEGSPDVLYTIDPDNNFSETAIGNTNQDEGANWAAAFADSAGAVYFYNVTSTTNTPTGFYSADLTSGTLTLVSTADEWSRADGANCPLVELQQNTDYGDLPDSPYPTLKANNGARHLIKDAGPILGSAIDKEDDGQPTPNADGDDTNGATPDDEDGVSRIAGLGSSTGGWTNGTVASGNGGALEITVGTVSGTNVTGYVQVWLDFGDGNGLTEVALLDGTGTTLSQPMAVGTHTVYFDIPDNTFDPSTSPKDIYARVRISSQGGLDAAGEADDGEVEDYLWTFGPNAVTLRSFNAQETPWRTSDLTLAILMIGLALVIAGGALLFRRSRA